MIKSKLGNMMKQAQKMQQDLKRIQDELATLEVVGEASGGDSRVSHQEERASREAGSKLLPTSLCDEGLLCLEEHSDANNSKQSDRGQR